MSKLDVLWIEQPVLHRAYLAQSSYNILLGALLIGGGFDRVAGDSYYLIRELGGPYPWGAIFMLVGLLIFTSRFVNHQALGLATLMASILHAWFAAQFIATAAIIPLAGLTGAPTYAIVAYWHSSVAISHYVGPRR